MKKQNNLAALALYVKARKLQTEGNFKQAFFICDQILQIDPKHADTLCLKGVILSENKQYIPALTLYNQALTIKKDAHIYNNRGNVFQFLKQYEFALDDFDVAIKLDKKLTEAYYNKGNCYKALHDNENALIWFKKCAEIDPSYYAAWNNIGLCYQDTNQFEKALAAYTKAVELAPDNAFCHNNKAYALQTLMRLDEAKEEFTKAIQLDENNFDFKFNIGFVHLAKGDLDNGWAGHEMRYKTMYSPGKKKGFWEGEDLTDKTFIISHEQGLGDTFQFIRHAKQIKELGAKKVIAAVKPEAFELIKSMPYIDDVFNDPKDWGEYDYYCPVMSVPAVLKIRVENIPYEQYLFANPEKVQEFKNKMGDTSKLRVGIVWSGGFRKDMPQLWAVNNRRNVPFEKLAPILELDADFYSLQFGENVEQMNNLINECKNFADTAALIECLDLVIAVDTSTAHVAGALNKPVWLMNRFDTCWRWLENRRDTPWYPSMTIYRQNEFNNWDNVIQDIKVDLEQKIKNPAL